MRETVSLMYNGTLNDLKYVSVRGRGFGCYNHVYVVNSIYKTNTYFHGFLYNARTFAIDKWLFEKLLHLFYIWVFLNVVSLIITILWSIIFRTFQSNCLC